MIVVELTGDFQTGWYLGWEAKTLVHWLVILFCVGVSLWWKKWWLAPITAGILSLAGSALFLVMGGNGWFPIGFGIPLGVYAAGLNAVVWYIAKQFGWITDGKD